MFRNIFARIAQPFVRLGVRLGQSMQQVGRALSRAGVIVETETLRREAQVIRREVEAGARVMGLSDSAILDPANMPEALTKLRRNFSYRVRTTYINAATGKQESRFVTVASESVLSRDQILSEAQELIDDYDEIVRAIDMEVVSASKAGAFGRL